MLPSSHDVPPTIVPVVYEPVVCLSLGFVHGSAASAHIGAPGTAVVEQVAAAIGLADRPTSVAVKLAGHTLRDEHLPEVVFRTLVRHGVPAERISCDVKETHAASDVRSAMATFQELRDLGCEMGIEGFGATVASFRLLDQLGADYVKLDRSRVARLLVDPDALTEVTALLHAAHQRGVGTIAEGVGRHEQVVWLRDLGCELAQGPWFGPPETRPILSGAHACSS